MDERDNQIDQALVLRYVAGECTSAERVRVERWMDVANQRAYVASLRDIVRTTAQWTDKVESAAAFEQLKSRLAGQRALGEVAGSSESRQAVRAREVASHFAPRTRGPVSWRRGFLSVAAVAGIVIAVGLLTGHVLTRGSPIASTHQFVTAAGERSAITLGDGTRLVLGPASHLRVPSDFGAPTRTLELTGEAVFTVVHDPTRPFAVRTPLATVRDIGTVFAVRDYGDGAPEQLAVRSGAVSVGTNTVRANEVARVSAAGQVTVRTVQDVTPYLAWSQGQLAFAGTPLREAVREIGRTYDLDVTVADSVLGAKLVTASFTDQAVDVILDDITAVVDAEFHRVGRTVTISRRTAATIRQKAGVRPQVQSALVTSGRE